MERCDGIVFHRGMVLDAGVVTEGGFLKVPAVVGKVGVVKYLQPDGSIRAEFRPPEELFAPASLATLGLVPATMRHPSRDMLPLTPENVRAHEVGSVGDNIVQDGDKLIATVVIRNKKAIELAKRTPGVSPGYYRELEYSPGEYNGERYQYVQRNIRYDHLAVCEPMPRGGSDVSLMLDGVEAASLKEKRNVEEETVVINGVEYTVPRSAAQAIAAERKQTKISLDSLSASESAAIAQRDAAQGKADAAAARVSTLEAELAEARSPAALAARVKARAALVGVASAHGIATDSDDVTDEALRDAVLAKAYPAISLDGRSEEYKLGLFSALHAKDASVAPRSRTVIESPNLDGEAEKPQLSARDKFISEQAANRYKSVGQILGA